jgi:D-lactate dehydrogenase (cytochrome)
MDHGLLDRFKAIVGPKGWTDDPAALAPHLTEWRDRYRGATPLMVSPRSTAEVAALIGLCAETRTGLVPQGGNTGLVGGQIPQGEILLSLRRLNKIRAIDALNDTITVEAGCILADVQAAAAAADRLFPLSLAAEGSATIGGNLSTNAGGTAVLRYGNARALALGLEVVLPDGQILDMLRGLRKDNTGYDLKQLFIGAEGTLGIITAAVLTLFPRPRAQETALAALPRPEQAIALLHLMRSKTGDSLVTFELMPRIGLDFVTRHIPNTRDPFAAPHPWYVLIELQSGQDPQTAGLRDTLEAALLDASEAGLLRDALIAESEAQRRAFARLRETLSEAQKYEGGSIKCDIAVPVSAIPAFLAEAEAAVLRACPGIRPVPFGHAGDGNIHFNLSEPPGADRAAILARWDALSALVHEIAARHGGSISAEHGLGQMKNFEIRRYKSAVEIDLMRRVKACLDPHGIMNPGKLV